MTQVYFRCSNPKEVLVDRCGAVVDDLAACVVRSLTMARSLEDWRSWILHVSDDLGDELFVAPSLLCSASRIELAVLRSLNRSTRGLT